MPEDKNSYYFSAQTAFTLNFEESPIDLKSVYENGHFKRPELFEEMVTKTRNYLNSPRAKQFLDPDFWNPRQILINNRTPKRKNS